MSDALHRFAEALDEPPLPTEEVTAILDLTRDVAHGTERKLAPLTSYLVGLQVGRQLEGGVDRGEAFAGAVDRVLATLPDDTPDHDSPDHVPDDGGPDAGGPDDGPAAA